MLGCPSSPSSRGWHAHAPTIRLGMRTRSIPRGPAANPMPPTAAPAPSSVSVVLMARSDEAAPAGSGPSSSSSLSPAILPRRRNDLTRETRDDGYMVRWPHTWTTLIHSDQPTMRIRAVNRGRRKYGGANHDDESSPSLQLTLLSITVSDRPTRK